MSHVSYSELRANLAHYLDKVCDDRAPLYVTRPKSRAVVMLSEEEYNSMVETMHLLSSPTNAERLRQSIADANAGRLTEHDLIED